MGGVMKLTTIVLTFVLACCLANAQVSHIYRQFVLQVPDTTGHMWYSWDLHNMADANDYLDLNTTGCGSAYQSSTQRLRWYAEAGNFPGHEWLGGDTLVVLGSWDEAYANNPATYGDNPDHLGSYWLFSDTMDATVDAQILTPDDTLREMPKPIATQATESTTNYVQ